MTRVGGAGIAFATTLLACPLVLRTIRQRVLDEPNHRSSHDEPTPRGGGLAIVLGAAVGIVLVEGLSVWRPALILVAVAYGLLGLLDDLQTMRAGTRLGAQVVIAVASLPLLLQDLTGPLLWKVVFSAGVAMWLMSYVNAFNFMDGINGISVAQAVVAGAAWWLIGRAEDVPALAAGALVIAVCAAAFAPFNYPQARMFLGDVGSYFLGAWIAILVVVGLRSELPAEAVFAPVAVALADTSSTLVRRVLRGETWHEAHRDHVYQRLVRAGWSHAVTTSVVAVTVTACSAVGAATIALRGSPARLAADAVLAAILLAYLASPTLLAGSAVRRSVPAQ